MKPSGDDPTLTPDMATSPAARESRPVSIPELPGYVPGETIGRGGMGEVIVAYDIALDREVALKRMKGSTPSEDAIARFTREAKVQARLDHPSIVPVHEVGTDANGQPYFTMKRLVGTTLAERLAQGGPVQPLLRAFVDVCFAIERAHSRNIVHRDIKPSNVMLGDYGDVYVIDWGVARVLKTRRTSTMFAAVDALEQSDDETAAGAMLGTPGFMAPEQMRGDDVGPSADIYALGALLFEILAGEPLHPPGKSAISATLAKPTQSPAERRPDRGIAPELDALCVAALAEAKDKRPSARELAERVQRYLDGDRDLERRKLLAREQLEVAHAATNREEAGQAASRALALDPESTEAAKLVSQLILEPPKEIPPELAAALEAEEIELNKQRGRSATLAFLSLWVMLPVFLFLQYVQSVPQLILLYAVVTGMAVISWDNGRRGKTPTWVTMAGNLAVALMFSRLTGSFILTMGLICGQTLALSSRSFVANRSWPMLLWIAAATLIPFSLEWFGVIEATWRMTPEGIVSHGTIMHTVRNSDVIVLAFSQTALALVVGLFAMSVTRAREAAQRRAFIQAWHLQQLVPKQARESNPALSIRQ
jgi:serine/threonine-protein kinase